MTKTKAQHKATKQSKATDRMRRALKDAQAGVPGSADRVAKHGHTIHELTAPPAAKKGVTLRL